MRTRLDGNDLIDDDNEGRCFLFCIPILGLFLEVAPPTTLSTEEWDAGCEEDRLVPRG